MAEQTTNGSSNLNYYDPQQGFSGRIGRTAADSEPAWPSIPKAPDGAPNILLICLDDTGFGQIGCYGGLGGRIQTPNMDRLAARGLRYNNMHTTALCSPTRAALLTGRNHHSVGVGIIMEFATGYPGYNAQMPHESATISEVLVEKGYNTMCLGKWHLAPDEHIGPTGPYDRWPLGRGFERYYGFLSGDSSQWRPVLWQDNSRVEPPKTPDEGYHLTEDLADKAIQWITEQKAVAPSKPFFMYFATGATHAPHHVHKSYVDRYKGAFDVGWDVVREETLKKQKEIGLIPENTDLPERNPAVKAWNDLDDVAKKVFCRQMETYAGFLTHTDEQIGRLVNLLEQIGQLDNTLIMIISDNGASGEGGPEGLLSEVSYFNMVPETMDDKLRGLDRWGQPGTYPHYATGWAMAGNTPNRWYKQFVHEGGTRDPFIVSWPARIQSHGEIRSQFHHVVDVAPTILEAVELEMPATVKGYPQTPLEGVSMLYSFDDAAAKTRKQTQYFEMAGHRALWKDGWKLVAFHKSQTAAATFGLEAPEKDLDFDRDQWELYHLDEDFSESHDLAATHPDKVKELEQDWWHAAETYQVLPLDDRMPQRLVVPKPKVIEEQEVYTFFNPVKLIRSVSPNTLKKSFSITAEVDIPEQGAEGAIVSNGGSPGGYVLGLKDGHVHFVSSFVGRDFTVISSDVPVPNGPVTIRVEFKRDGEADSTGGTGTLYIGDRQVGQKTIPATNPAGYATTEGFEVGGDGTAPVWPGVKPPFKFTGTIRRVDLRIGDERLVDPNHLAKVAMYKQ